MSAFLDPCLGLQMVMRAHEAGEKDLPILVMIGPLACGKTVLTNLLCKGFQCHQVHQSRIIAGMFEWVRTGHVLVIELAGRKITARHWKILAGRPPGMLVVIHGHPVMFGLPEDAQCVQILALKRKEVGA